MDKIYMDAAATTKPSNHILDAITPYIIERWYNPSALYSEAKNVKADIEEVRSNVAEYLNVQSNEIFFTSGATESNNWVLRGFVDNCFKLGYYPVILTTYIEHKSILQCCENIKKIYQSNVAIHKLMVNVNGNVSINDLHTKLKMHRQHNTRILVSIQFANSEIGTIQDLKPLIDIVHSYPNAVIHTDATQIIGKYPVNVGNLGVDFLSASAQKFNGLKGCGILYKNSKCNQLIEPLIYGSQENGQRGGTENVIGIIALGEAIKFCKTHITLDDLNITKDCVTCYFTKKLKEWFNCHINSTGFLKLNHIINVTFPQNITGEALIYMLNTAGVMISSGSACNSYTNQPSDVLKAIGLSDEKIMKTVRFSLSDDITCKQIDYVLDEIDKAIKILDGDVG